MGSAGGAPIPPGFYFANQVNWGCASTTPRTCVVTEIPVFVTPWLERQGVQFRTGTTVTDIETSDKDGMTLATV
jgi:hypothetical protein